LTEPKKSAILYLGLRVDLKPQENGEIKMTEQEKVQAELMIKAQEYAYACMAEGLTLEESLAKCNDIIVPATEFLTVTAIKFTYAGGCDLSPSI